MLCDAISHYCLSFSIFRGRQVDVDKAETKIFCLAYIVIMKLLQMGKYLRVITYLWKISLQLHILQIPFISLKHLQLGPFEEIGNSCRRLSGTNF
jgi:hypothetical protein